jgi:hypothetical protein
MDKPSVAVPTILAFVGVLLLAGCGAQEVVGTAAPASAPAAVAPATAPPSDPGAAYKRLVKLRIACTIVTAAELRTVGVPGDSSESGEDCFYRSAGQAATPSARLSIGFHPDRDRFRSMMLDSNAFDSVSTTVVDGVTVYSGRAATTCGSAAQRDDSAFAALEITYPSGAPSTCDDVSALVARGVKRIPASP